MNPSPACLALLILFALPARAEIYKWTDEKGKVHYGDQAPADPKTKTLSVKPALAERRSSNADRQQAIGR